MKLVAVPVVALVAALMSFPVLFATGDATVGGCGMSSGVGAVLATIRTLESGGDYTAQAGGSSASGAYQFVDGTWGNFGGYPQAWQAPPAVQDAKAAEHVQGILDANGGDVTAVPVVWYIGHLPAAGSAEWDTVPVPGAGNRFTPRQYQDEWLAELQRQLVRGAGPEAQLPVTSCDAGSPIAILADGYAYPGPAELFADAPVDEPHHDYPAWDWGIPVGTPIYAVTGGTVTTVQYWPHNWWDHGCGDNPAGCHTCGVGVTIRDDHGNRWAYCHGSAVHVKQDDTIAAGTQILTSGNTGRSGIAHLHIQITTPDEQLRCPQHLVRSLRDNGLGVDPATLPTAGCSYPS